MNKKEIEIIKTVTEPWYNVYHDTNKPFFFVLSSNELARMQFEGYYLQHMISTNQLNGEPIFLIIS